MEPNEIPEFTRQMKESGEASLTRISLAISILAVLVAMVTVLGHRTHTEAILQQSRANDAWNEYEGKKIRVDNLAVTIDLMTLQPSSDPAAVQKKLAEYQAHLTKWTSDLNDLTKTAKGYEHATDQAEDRADRYDLGEALLQIAVVLCSITLFTRQNRYFFTGLLLGAAGILTAATALLVR